MKLESTGNQEAEAPGEGLVAKAFDSILRATRNHGQVLNKEELALDCVSFFFNFSSKILFI